ncbi:MAG: O-antigen ligase family protein [Clostridia bacterium]|nr:O-antigen ligase family protein [Clostridia bacterium]
MRFPKAETLADRLWTLMACLWLGLFPLWQDGSFTRITRAKWLGMLLLTAVCVLLTLLTAVYAALRREKLPFRVKGIQLAAVIYFGWMGLSAWLAPMSGTLNSRGEITAWMGALRYEGMATQLCYMMILLVMCLHPVRLKPVCHAAAVALLVFFAITLLQYAGYNPIGLFPAGRSIRTNYEFQGTIGNIDMVSGYLALVVPLLLGAFLTAERGGWQWYAAGMAGVLLWLCIEVQSGLIALVAGLLLTACAMLRRQEVRRRGWLIAAGVILCAGLRGCILLPWLDGASGLRPDGLTVAPLALAAMILALRKPRLRPLTAKQTAAVMAGLLAAGVIGFLLLPLHQGHGGIWEIQQTLLGHGEDAFGSYRLGVWRHTLALAQEHPLLGTGPDTFLHALRLRLASLGQQLPETFDNPHNEYLAILANCGLPALLAYAAILALRLRTCVRHSAWALLAVTVCFAAQGFFSFSICLVSPMWWCTLGMEEKPPVSYDPV